MTASSAISLFLDTNFSISMTCTRVLLTLDNNWLRHGCNNTVKMRTWGILDATHSCLLKLQITSSSSRLGLAPPLCLVEYWWRITMETAWTVDDASILHSTHHRHIKMSLCLYGTHYNSRTSLLQLRLVLHLRLWSSSSSSSNAVSTGCMLLSISCSLLSFIGQFT